MANFFCKLALKWLKIMVSISFPLLQETKSLHLVGKTCRNMLEGYS